MKSLGKLLHISWFDRWLLIEAAITLYLVRLTTVLIPFKFIAPRLGQVSSVTDIELNLENETLVKRISWAIHVMEHHAPWKNTCLVISIAAKRILQRRHIPSTLYLGMAKNDQKVLEAHAWLQCGKIVVTGEYNHQRYTNMITFSDHFA